MLLIRRERAMGKVIDLEKAKERLKQQLKPREGDERMLLVEALENIERENPGWTESDVDMAWMKMVEEDDELGALAIELAACIVHNDPRWGTLSALMEEIKESIMEVMVDCPDGSGEKAEWIEELDQETTDEWLDAVAESPYLFEKAITVALCPVRDPEMVAIFRGTEVVPAGDS
jgi:hypothetical protein